jgi:hypothetical protein
MVAPKTLTNIRERITQLMSNVHILDVLGVKSGTGEDRVDTGVYRTLYIHEDHLLRANLPSIFFISTHKAYNGCMYLSMQLEFAKKYAAYVI